MDKKKFTFTPDKLMIALFAVVMLAVPIATFITPKQEKSEVENRTLAKFPTEKLINKKKLEKAEDLGGVMDAVQWDYLINREGKSFMDDFEKYFSDHLIGRETWVKASNGISRILGTKEINGVYTTDGKMIQIFREYDKEEVEKSLQAMDKFAERFPDKQMYFMLVPTAQEMNKSKIPSYMEATSQKAFIEECCGSLENITTIDALSHLSGHSDEYIYYRTDHHWTSLGAYYAYTAAAKSMGFSAYGLNSFNIETASSDFLGTLYSKTLDDGIEPDVMDYYILAEGEPEIKMLSMDGKQVTEYDSLYVREYLDVKDKYSSFTGSNVPIVDIKTNVDNGKNLLMIKDSYAHSLVPFLSKHYSRITMVDMRYINTDLGMFIDLDDYQQVLFMQNVITFSEDTYLKKLALTKGNK